MQVVSAQAPGPTLLLTIRCLIRADGDLVGLEHIALGSGFNGAAPTPIDAGGWSKLTQALLDDGFSKDEIAQIMGGNAIRILQQVLPANS